MLQRRWRCACGKEALVPVQALGETVICPACGAASVITLKNSHPVAPAPDVLKPVAVAEHADNCARCGRKFRGPWDQHASEEGTLCDICARQVGQPTAKPPATASPASQHPQAAAMLSVTTDDLRYVHEAITPDILLREPDAAQRYYLRLGAMIVAALVVVSAVIGYLVLYAPDSVDAYKEQQWQGLAYLLAERFLSRLLLGFATLYPVLWYLDRLPNDNTVSNVLAVGAVCVLLAVVGMVGVNGFLALAGTLLTLLLLRYLYDFGWIEFLALSVWNTLLNFSYTLAYLLLYNAQS